MLNLSADAASDHACLRQDKLPVSLCQVLGKLVKKNELNQTQTHQAKNEFKLKLNSTTLKWVNSNSQTKW